MKSGEEKKLCRAKKGKKESRVTIESIQSFKMCLKCMQYGEKSANFQKKIFKNIKINMRKNI